MDSECFTCFESESARDYVQNHLTGGELKINLSVVWIVRLLAVQYLFKN